MHEVSSSRRQRLIFVNLVSVVLLTTGSLYLVSAMEDTEESKLDAFFVIYACIGMLARIAMRLTELLDRNANRIDLLREPNAPRFFNQGVSLFNHLMSPYHQMEEGSDDEAAPHAQRP